MLELRLNLIHFDNFTKIFITNPKSCEIKYSFYVILRNNVLKCYFKISCNCENISLMYAKFKRVYYIPGNSLHRHNFESKLNNILGQKHQIF